LNNLNKKEVEKTIKGNKDEMLQSLTEQFQKDLLWNMIFFLFNLFRKTTKGSFQAMDSGERIDIAKHFIKVWSGEIKKRADRELGEINKTLSKNANSQIMDAMLNGKIGSTEDYSLIYRDAIQNVQKMYNNSIFWGESQDEGEEDW
jgi:hypothetical protein